MAPSVISLQDDLFFDAASTPKQSTFSATASQASVSPSAASAASAADIIKPFKSVQPWSEFEQNIIAYIQLGKEGPRATASSDSLPTHQFIEDVSAETESTTAPPYNAVTPPDHHSIPASGLSSPCMEEVITSMDSITKMAEIFLEKQNVVATFSRNPVAFQIGSPDVTLLLGKTGQPCMVGMYTTDHVFPSIANDLFFLETLKNSDKTDKSSPHAHGIELIHRIYTYMALNNLKYGFISTSTYTRFFKRTSTAASCIEFSPVVSLFQSSPYTIMGCLVAMGMQCKYGALPSSLPFTQPSHTSFKQVSTGMSNREDICLEDFYLDCDTLTHSLYPICLPTPTTYNLSHAGRIFPGRNKWWKVMQTKKMVCRIHFSQPTNTVVDTLSDPLLTLFANRPKGLPPPYSTLPRIWGIVLGQVEITENEIQSDNEDEYEMLKHNEIQRGHRRYRGLDSCTTKKSTATHSVVFKTCDYSCNNINSVKTQNRLIKLDNEARMYEHFQSHDKPGIPKLRVFGDVLGCLRVLALEPCGRQLTASDFCSTLNAEDNTRSNDHVLDLVKKMRTALSDVHSTGVLHRDIRLSNFVIDEEATNGRVRIINFGKARLYVRLYPQAMEEELAVLEKMCLEAMRGRVSEEFI